eukprot:scaffold12412_cov75-Phaeocystis_antarctica.AAC.1
MSRASRPAHSQCSAIGQNCRCRLVFEFSYILYSIFHLPRHMDSARPHTRLSSSRNDSQLTWHRKTTGQRAATHEQRAHGVSSVPALACPPRAASPCPFVSPCQPTTRGPPAAVRLQG